MAKRLKHSERLNIIVDYLNGKPNEDFDVIETKDKHDNDVYIVRRKVKPKVDREILLEKIAKLKEKLEKIDQTDDNLNTIKDDVSTEQ